MTSMLPPTRDLPPGRHSQIRAELEDAVVGGGRRSRLAVPILAAAAAVTTVAASMVMLRPSASEPSPAVNITTSPAAPTSTQSSSPTPGSPSSPPPGFPDPTKPDIDIKAEMTPAIEEGCAKVAGVGKATLYQLLSAETTWALLYTDKEALSCDVGRGDKNYSAAVSQTSVPFLPGHFSVDVRNFGPGGDVVGGPSWERMPGYRTVVGRIGPKVKKVTYTVDGQTVEAKIERGTYAARISYPSNWTGPNQSPEVVRAYDENGELLGSSTDLENTCYYTPNDMKVVYGTRKQENADCKPVSPWR
ncbi:hypothetical protein [Lentzea sp. NPDC051838]|uniref:hypothetical protein n=1 Tax=Lentzea sp. NPDC051838 TaxID=3154849 RepID=UPI00342AF1ED